MIHTERLKSETPLLPPMLETAPAYMYHVSFEDGAPSKRFHSPTCKNVLGYAAHEYDADPNLWLKMIHDQDRERVLDFFHDLHESEKTQCCEITHRIVKKDGSVMWALNRLTKTVDSDNGKADLTGVIIDITYQKETELALQEGERRYRELFENANDIVFTMDDTGRIMDINRGGLRLLGYKKEEALEMSIFELTTGDRVEQISRMLHPQVCPDGKESRIEILFKTKNGYRIPTEVSACAAPEYKGEVRILAIARDITERKAAEEMYQLLTENLDERIKELDCLYQVSAACSDPTKPLRSVINQVAGLLPAAFKYPNLTCVRVDVDGIVAMAGQSADPKFGIKAEVKVFGQVEGVVEVSYCQPTPHLDEGPFMKEEKHLIHVVAEKLGTMTERIRAQEDLVFSNENLFVTKEYLETALKRMESLNRETRAAHSEAEAARIKAVREKEVAVEATQLKDRFVSLVVHDLKSPFSTMISLLRLIHDDQSPQLDDRHRDIVSKVISSGERMLKMIEELLDISRLQSGAIMPRRQFIDARFLVADVFNTHQNMADKKKVELVNGLIAETRIYADVGLLSEALGNLVENAIKFSHKGGVVRVFQPEKPGAVLAVGDRGCGINAKLLPDLFRQDIKTSTLGTSGEKGTGLGLPYVMDIIRAHDGDLEVESREKEGSVFYIHLPVRKPLVLLVDDDADYRKIISTILGQLDLEILEANNGAAGLKIVRDKNPHLVILDLMMPGMSGLEVIREIKADTATEMIPVLVVTSSGNDERESAFRAGANDLVGKEMLIQELRPRVKRLLNMGAFLT
ncbi:MAG: PAS domain S-box protein [Nitrospinota bacterium]|nr:PAS domain S-box protein [Nitrospinota bacterium]